MVVCGGGGGGRCGGVYKEPSRQVSFIYFYALVQLRCLSVQSVMLCFPADMP